MIRLTERAKEYLSSLERRRAPGRIAVADALRSAGLPTLDVWLEFHEAFAGYVERLGRDAAVYGLMHEHGEWLVNIEGEADGDGWLIMCADAHPSYDYYLTETGEFTGSGCGGPFQAFSQKIERDAVFASLSRRGWRRDRDACAWSSARVAEELGVAGEGLVKEGSDADSSLYLREKEAFVVRAGRIVACLRPA